MAIALPLTVEDALEHLRLGGTADPAEYLEVERMLNAAVQVASDWTNRAWVVETRTASFDCFPVAPAYQKACLYLDGGVVDSIVSLTYYDTDYVQQTLDPSAYRLVTGRGRGKVYPAMGEEWPTDSAEYEPEQITVTYTVGSGVVPAPVVSAILLILGSLYEYREDGVIDNAGLALVKAPIAALDLLRPYKLRIA